MGFDEQLTPISVRTALDECWVLDVHRRDSSRTDDGELVRRAKYQRDRSAADRLGQRVAAAVAMLVDNPKSRMQTAERIVPVPANPPKAPFSLPDILAAEIAARLRIPLDLELVRKLPGGPKVKGIAAAEAAKTLEWAFRVADWIDDRRVVVIVDDLVRSGSTLEAVGGQLRERGAQYLMGVAATKADRDTVL